MSSGASRALLAHVVCNQWFMVGVQRIARRTHFRGNLWLAALTRNKVSSMGDFWARAGSRKAGPAEAIRCTPMGGTVRNFHLRYQFVTRSLYLGSGIQPGRQNDSAVVCKFVEQEVRGLVGCLLPRCLLNPVTQPQSSQRDRKSASSARASPFEASRATSNARHVRMRRY